MEKSIRLQNAINLYMEGIRDGNAREAVEKYTGARYTQHSTGVRDGKEGFIEFFEPFLARNPVRDIQIVRAIEDDKHVFLHAHQSLNNGEAQWVTTDFFDFDAEGKIIEHWDVIAEFSPSNPSGHSSVDGPTEVTDLELTSENREIVRGLIEDGLMRGGNPDNLSRYISAEQYIQHNREVADGLEHFQKLASMPNRPLNYDELVLIVAQGNFVASLCKANWKDAEMEQDYAQVDIFRLERGKVVEHWDNVEPVPENDVNGGKF